MAVPCIGDFMSCVGHHTTTGLAARRILLRHFWISGRPIWRFLWKLRTRSRSARFPLYIFRTSSRPVTPFLKCYSGGFAASSSNLSDQSFQFRMSDYLEGDSEIALLIERYLVCPLNHGPLVVRETNISCTTCGFRGGLRDGVAVFLEGDQGSFFDDKFEIMRHGLLERGTEWRICCEKQVALLEKHFEPGQIVLDVGCGPYLPYKPSPDVFVIGLEPSFPSIRENSQVNLPVCGSATDIPVSDRSVDLAIAFYSIHHMVGKTVRENDEIVQKAFAEFARVVKPGGSLFVFEMTPWRPFAAVQHIVWNRARRLVGGKLDMYFRSARSMSELGRMALPNASLATTDYRCSPFEVFPP